ncbi:MAG: glycoside hydrolase family 3 protein [Rhodocyclales bacterium GT-UBC]|nr:MAG: glycoside hydrolase family 3 protein [Rhodocyclales bacterium GT-UBC]
MKGAVSGKLLPARQAARATWPGRLAGFVAPFLLIWAWNLKHPLLFSLRHVETPLLVGLPLLALLICRPRLPPLPRLMLCLVLLLTLWREVEYRLQRQAVLAAGPVMQAVGSHFIVGYTDFAEVSHLAGQGLIGGIYLGKRNLLGRRLADVAAEIRALQAIRQGAELPPLIVAADQEGGAVSHLSPLLEALPPLATLVGTAYPELQATAYGQRQGLALAALGVTLNFSPVVDLRSTAPGRPDPFSNIPARAISARPQEVIEIAGAYLDGLQAAGIHGTLKHFPGLARIKQDTHLWPARLDATSHQLAADWSPFQALAGRAGCAMMLGHVILERIDAGHAASHSARIVDGLLRGTWGYDGVLLTDDLNMGAVYPRGIGRVAGEALAAGVDLVLVSYDPRQFYRAAYGAGQALESHAISRSTLAASRQRLADMTATTH